MHPGQGVAWLATRGNSRQRPVLRVGPAAGKAVFPGNRYTRLRTAVRTAAPAGDGAITPRAKER